MISLVPGEGTSYCLEQGSDLKEKRDRGIYCNFVRVFFFFGMTKFRLFYKCRSVGLACSGQ